KGWTISDTVILARGMEYADALAGVPLAYKEDAPILLTPSDELWDATASEIERLGASEAIILGGSNAISDDVSSELEYLGLEVKRIAGDTRFETAALIASEVAPEGIDKVVVANGMDFPDALSVASFAAKEGFPILLTKSDWMPEATTDTIVELESVRTIVVGGPSVVNDSIIGELPKTKRLYGHD